MWVVLVSVVAGMFFFANKEFAITETAVDDLRDELDSLTNQRKVEFDELTAALAELERDATTIINDAETARAKLIVTELRVKTLEDRLSETDLHTTLQRVADLDRKLADHRPWAQTTAFITDAISVASDGFNEALDGKVADLRSEFTKESQRAGREQQRLHGQIAATFRDMAEQEQSIDSRLVAHDEWLSRLQEASDDSSLTAAVALGSSESFGDLSQSLEEPPTPLIEFLKEGMSIRAIERAAARALPFESEVRNKPKFATNAVKTLIHTSKGNKYVTVRIAAIRALGDFPKPNLDDGIKSVLCDMLKDMDEDWLIRRAAALALGERGSKLSGKMRSDIIDELDKVRSKERKESNAEVLRAATDSLRLLGR